MLVKLTKRICIAVASALIAAANPVQPSTAKGGGMGVRTNDGRKHFTLNADAVWQLDVSERFDASALTFYHGKLLTINDRDAGFFEISSLGTNGLAKVKRSEYFPRRELANAAPRRASRYDCEGLAVDENGDLLVSEESQRLVFRSSPDAKSVKALVFDWAPVRKFFGPDANASFEGIAVGGGRLYLANERSSARIIEIDLKAGTVVDSFFVDSDSFAFGGPHYTDLAFRDGRLFILNRNHRCIFEVDPNSRKVLAEYSFAKMELDEEVAYRTDYPTGSMEGLAIDEHYFWLITDNNGKARFKHPGDTRPTLFRCKRPTL